MARESKTKRIKKYVLERIKEEPMSQQQLVDEISQLKQFNDCSMDTIRWAVYQAGRGLGRIKKGKYVCFTLEKKEEKNER